MWFLIAVGVCGCCTSHAVWRSMSPAAVYLCSVIMFNNSLRQEAVCVQAVICVAHLPRNWRLRLQFGVNGPWQNEYECSRLLLFVSSSGSSNSCPWPTWP
ncbi:hypothetical protein COO60DRAFT_475446 [Scenedesmus sp. NREL 46B-D3]|nr:hypothetical protein COO60DRAFT_475446 [Scenedesmus sp. NREL 46B-D3]